VLPPHDPVRRAALEAVLEDTCVGRGLRVIGWTTVPTNADCLGELPSVDAGDPPAGPSPPTASTVTATR